MRINTSFTAFGLWGRRSSAGLWHIQWATGDDAPISAVFLQAKLRDFLDSGGKLPYIMSNYISESTKTVSYTHLDVYKRQVYEDRILDCILRGEREKTLGELVRSG